MKNEFFQEGPRLTNQYEADPLLPQLLRQKLTGDTFSLAQPELKRMGERVVTDLLAASENAETVEPVHTPFDPWGRRIDNITMSPGWTHISRAAAEEGIVATGYERKYGVHSRLIQFAKLYLFHPSSAFVSCPLAMSDGAARAIELYGDEELKRGPFKKLISRDPGDFWTSGQWMTEKTGGSDVSGTSTVAKKGKGGYELHGVKWFTSATTSQMAMALARIEGHPEGSKGLSLFYIPVRDEQGRLQNIEILRLKDKLGTRAMPTAELMLKGAPATLVGGEGNGVKKIASLFNITRMYNSVCALGATRRALALISDYGRRRSVFGKLLAEQPLHADTMADLVVEFEGNFLLTFHLAELLGRDELGKSSPEESAMLRMLTPIAKLYTAKSCMAITSEVVEAFGGAGYVEDSGLPVLLRNAQVFPIWEGTTNVLSLDVLRAIEKEGAFEPFLDGIQKRLASVKAAQLTDEVTAVKATCAELESFLGIAAQEGPDFAQASARRFAYALAGACAASLLLERAAHDKSARSLEIARRWCRSHVSVFPETDGQYRKASLSLFP
ncbi:MAG TPA: acyl-CoA dehydrogenase family protein [Bdellovibrionota bacterium]|jgi:alkylation response protein AidB-like acyl-CoA dehydrogenase